jgi:hypothetical protein
MSSLASDSFSKLLCTKVVKIVPLEDNSNSKGARGAFGDVLSLEQLKHSDGKFVSTRTVVEEGSKALLPVHVVNLHFVVNTHLIIVECELSKGLL